MCDKFMIFIYISYSWNKYTVHLQLGNYCNRFCPETNNCQLHFIWPIVKLLEVTPRHQISLLSCMLISSIWRSRGMDAVAWCMLSIYAIVPFLVPYSLIALFHLIWLQVSLRVYLCNWNTSNILSYYNYCENVYCKTCVKWCLCSKLHHHDTRVSWNERIGRNQIVSNLHSTYIYTRYPSSRLPIPDSTLCPGHI